MTLPRVTVIIPHWNGEDFLRRCLLSLQKTTYPQMDVLVVDNHSTDASVEMIQTGFPEVGLIQNEVNLGFVGGCNLGIERSASPFFVLLNNDTEVTPEWLDAPVRMMLENSQLAGVQPKLRSLQNREYFDYCGGAGGELDIFGYPVTWGRVFEHIEKDTGQYNRPRSIFWATGAACVIRRTAVEHVGVLDNSFFAHMEEIDLFWRFHLAGYQVGYCPDSVVYHYNGGTLGQEKLMKMVLNHRNSQIMLLKNYRFHTLVWLYPVRMLLEGLTAIGSLVRGDLKRSAAVIIAFAGVLKRMPVWYQSRQGIQRMRVLQDKQVMQKMIRRSVALGFYFQKKRKITDFLSSSIET